MRMWTGFLLLTALYSTQLFADESVSIHGSWYNASAQEERTLNVNKDNTGQFSSIHIKGQCVAPLEVTIDGQFLQASGIAENCQRKDNAVAFQFTCQVMQGDQLRCKIDSIHLKSGSKISGVETFSRK